MTGFVIALCAPSGTGKTTVARRLVQARRDTVFSVSATTRAPRPGERDGVDYLFMGSEKFEALIEGGKLLEWARVHEEYYGTPLANLEQAERDSRTLILDIDVQGVRQVVAARPESVSIFLLPPSGDALLERIRNRGSEDEKQVKKRLETARSELAAVSEFDYVVVNEELDETVGAVAAIIDAERYRCSRSEAEITALRDRILADLGEVEP